MAAADQIREAVYRAPSGAKFSLQFDDVSRSGGKKTGVYEFPQQNQAEVQDLGNSNIKLPLSVYFTGQTAYADADRFVKALGERGPGALQHPRYGDLTVLPATWSQLDKLVDAIGRSEVQVEFITCPPSSVFPITAVQSQESVTASIDAAADIYAESAAGSIPGTAADRTTCRTRALASLDQVSGLAALVADNAELASSFDKALRDFEAGIDDLVADPTAMAQSISSLVRLPAKATGSIGAKLSGYGGLLSGSILAVPSTIAEAVQSGAWLSAIMSGAAESTTAGTTASRQEAVRNADELDNIRQTGTAAIEAAESAVPGYQSPAEVMALLADATSRAGSATLTAAFNLRSERRMTLTTERTPLELIYELTGDIASLDEFIESNDLQGDAILLIPAGTEVVYYV